MRLSDHSSFWLVCILAAACLAGAAEVAQKASGVFVQLDGNLTGIHFIHRNGGTGAKEMIETMGSGCAVFDFDNDGFPDIFL